MSRVGSAFFRYITINVKKPDGTIVEPFKVGEINVQNLQQDYLLDTELNVSININHSGTILEGSYVDVQLYYDSEGRLNRYYNEKYTSISNIPNVKAQLKHLGQNELRIAVYNKWNQQLKDLIKRFNVVSDELLKNNIKTVNISGETTINEGSNLVLDSSLVMENNAAIPTTGVQYQWCWDKGNGLEPINGQTNQQLSIKSTEEINGKKIVLKTTYNNKVVVSQPKTIQVVLQKIQSLTITGKKVIVTEGENISVTSNFSPNFGDKNNIDTSKIKYQWYLKDGQRDEIIQNQNGPSLDVKSTLNMNGKKVFLKASYKGSEVFSNSISLVVELKPAPAPVNPVPPSAEQTIESVTISGDNNYTVGDSLNLPCKVIMNEGQPPSSGITYKWYKKDNSSETIISDQSSKVLSITIDASYKNKSIVVEATYKNKSVKSQPFVLNIKDKPVIPDQKPSAPSLPTKPNNPTPSKPNGSGGSSNKPSNTVNGIDGNSGLVEDSGLDWWIYAAIGGGVLLIIIAITIIVVSNKKKKQKKQVKQNMKIQQVVRANGSNVKTITTSRTIPTRTTSGAMPTFRNPPPTSKKR